MIAENNALLNFKVFVKFHEGQEFPLFFINGDVELFDTIQGQFFILHQDSGGITHEFLGNFQNLWGHGGREETDLDVTWNQAENVFDLVFESSTEHIIGFVDYDQLQGGGLQVSTLHHIVDSSGSTYHHMDTFLEDLAILGDHGTTAAHVDFDLQKFTQAEDDFLDLVGQFTGGS
jgi:hypothetical protein